MWFWSQLWDESSCHFSSLTVMPGVKHILLLHRFKDWKPKARYLRINQHHLFYQKKVDWYRKRTTQHHETMYKWEPQPSKSMAVLAPSTIRLGQETTKTLCDCKARKRNTGLGLKQKIRTQGSTVKIRMYWSLQSIPRQSRSKVGWKISRSCMSHGMVSNSGSKRPSQEHKQLLDS